MLRRLLAANGVQLGGGDAAVQDINDWFFVNVEPEPNNPGQLLPAGTRFPMTFRCSWVT
jgi:hypothetical protein